MIMIVIIIMIHESDIEIGDEEEVFLKRRYKQGPTKLSVWFL